MRSTVDPSTGQTRGCKRQSSFHISSIAIEHVAAVAAQQSRALNSLCTQWAGLRLSGEAARLVTAGGRVVNLATCDGVVPT
jgi:hypothetical protein